ncbi:hypothetical protein Tco_1010257 [Tanacetum coccineum]
MIGVLTYFLKFQTEQSKRGISINKERHVNDLLRKYDKIGSSVNTLIMPPTMLGLDLSGKAVNETQYRGMIGSLMYLTASRPNIQFSTCLCARYQANPKESHLIAVKRIFRKPFTRSPNMYKEYLAEFWYSAKALKNSKVSFSTPTGGIYGKVGVNTFRNAIGAHYLPHSSEYVAPSSIDIVRPWFEIIKYGEAVPSKGTLKKSLLPPRWRLLMAQIIQCLGGKTEGFDQITNKDAIILYSLVNGINIDYASIFWEDIIIKLNKKHRENVVPYTRFISLLMMHKMKEGYGDGELTPYPTQVFSVNNWALKPNQPEEPPFTDNILAIYVADMPVVFKAPKTSSKA